MADVPLYAQLINLLAAVLLLLAFAMLTQRRVLSLVNLFGAQGLAQPPAVALRPDQRMERVGADRGAPERHSGGEQALAVARQQRAKK